MAKTQYYTATSLDGFIADRDGSLEWLFQVDPGPQKEDRFGRFFADVGAMAMGATTYEWVHAHDQLLENPVRWRDYYGDTPCWVFTHRELPAVPGAELSFVHGDVRAAHDQLVRAAEGKNVWLVGGGDLAGQFADHGLLDEILLAVAPVTLGAGAPLFPRRLLSSDLTLVDVDRDTSFVHLTYRVGSGSASR